MAILDFIRFGFYQPKKPAIRMTEECGESKSEMHVQENDRIYETTEAFKELELTDVEFEDALRMLSECPKLLPNSRACVIFGYGSQTRQTYSEINSLDGVSVLWDGPFLPWVFRPLTLIVASHGGLIRIHDARQMKEVFFRLAPLGMVEMYSFAEDELDQVCEYVRMHERKSSIGNVIGRDPTYFSFGADGDTSFLATGFYAWLSYGEKCPDGLKAIASQVAGDAQN